MAIRARHRFSQHVVAVLLCLGMDVSGTARAALVDSVLGRDEVDPAHRVFVLPADTPFAEQIIEWAGLPDGDSPRDRRYWLREMPDRIGLALQSEGLYGVTIDLQDTTSGVELSLVGGVEVVFSEVAVSIPGARAGAPELLQWLERNALTLGERLQHSQYESLRDGLLNRAISLGYLDARYTRQQLSVSVRAATASVDLSLDLGEAYRVGKVEIDSSPVRSDIVRRLAPFEQGDRYTAEKLAAYARELRDSQFFAQARVSPVFDAIADGEVPLRVSLEPRKANRVRLGTGYATDVGFRVRAGWDRFLINDRGHSAAFDTELSKPRRSINAEYRVPDSRRPATRAWLFSAGALRESIDGASSSQQNARIARERRHGERLTDTTYLRYQLDRGLPDDSSVEFKALMAGVDVQAADDFSLGGERTLTLDGSMQLLGAHESVAADFSFLRAYMRVGARVEVQPRHWLRSRIEAGRLWRADVASMPTSLRFFAGGDGSVRGFGPREASPQNVDGVATGGNRLLVTSLEYEYRFREAWGVALFADRGRAWALSGEPVRTGAGAGLRWYSPVGPVMFDVARPVEEGDGDWRIHLTIGL